MFYTKADRERATETLTLARNAIAKLDEVLSRLAIRPEPVEPTTVEYDQPLTVDQADEIAAKRQAGEG